MRLKGSRRPCSLTREGSWYTGEKGKPRRHGKRQKNEFQISGDYQHRTRIPLRLCLPVSVQSPCTFRGLLLLMVSTCDLQGAALGFLELLCALLLMFHTCDCLGAAFLLATGASYPYSRSQRCLGLRFPRVGDGGFKHQRPTGVGV